MFDLLGKQLRMPTGNIGKIVAKMMNKRNAKFYSEIINYLDVKDNDKIFEIGYGPGLGIKMLAELNIKCTINGIDFSELMFKEAYERNIKFINQLKVKLSYGDFLTEDFSKQTYNKVFCLNVIYFWKDLGVAFRKISSILENNGKFCIFMTHESEFQNKKFAKDFCKYSVVNVSTALRNAGFSSVNYVFNNGYFITAVK